MTQKNKAIFQMLLCASLWSLAGVFIKAIPWNAFVISGSRSLIAGLVCVAYMRARRMSFRLNRQSVGGGVALCLTMTLFVIANKLTTAANAIVLQFTAPVFIMIFSVLFLKKHFSRADVAAVALVMGGVSLFFLDQVTPGRMLGNVIALGSGMAFAAMFMQMGGGHGADRMSAILLGDLLCAVLAIPFLILDPPEVLPRPVVYTLILGVVQLGIPYILLAKASEHCPPLACSLLSAVEPLLNPLWVFLFDGETPGLPALIGAAVIIVTVTGWCIYDARKATHPAGQSQ